MAKKLTGPDKIHEKDRGKYKHRHRFCTTGAALPIQISRFNIASIQPSKVLLGKANIPELQRQGALISDTLRPAA
jgi:hypothetical protein